MARYRVPLHMVLTYWAEVEADSGAEAIELAFDEAPSAGWDWPDPGDWTVASELFPTQSPSEDYELIEED